MLIERSGSGPNLILLHGWAMSRYCWHYLIPLVEEHFKTIRVDLPGHEDGCGSSFSFTEIDELIEELAGLCEGSATWLGWSLGGLLAQMVAQAYPHKVGRLICIASSACYVQKKDWPDGMPKKDLHRFSKAFAADSSMALENFLQMQVEGSEKADETLETLKVISANNYETEELTAALELLCTCDMRKALRNYKCPILFVGGGADKLMSAKNVEASAMLTPQGKSFIIDKAGHALMISHAIDFTDNLSEYLERTDAHR